MPQPGRRPGRLVAPWDHNHPRAEGRFVDDDDGADTLSTDPGDGPTQAADATAADAAPGNISSSDSISSDATIPAAGPIRRACTARSHSSAAEIRAGDDEELFETLERAVTPVQETAAERSAREPITYTRSGTSIASAATRPAEFEVVFAEDDPEHPRNWPLGYRVWIMGCVSYSTWVIVLYSTAYTASTPGLMSQFDATTTTTTLGLTTYLMGLAIGSLIVAPMSEVFGRRPVYLVCLSVWAVLIIPCGLANSLTTILVVRFFGALFGSAMISNGPGSVVDISNPDLLALAMSLWSIAPLNGPVTGPLIGGFVFQYLGWRWENWVSLVAAGLAVALMVTVRETYAPAILKRKAARLRKTTDDPRWWCQYDQRVSTLHLLRVNLSRPFILFATEPILWFMNVWIALVYGILYLCFVAYPIVFEDHRGWTTGLSGLAFVGIGVGTMLAICAEPLLRRVILSQPRDPETGRPAPEATALVMAIGAVLTPIGQLVFSWTCLPASIPWAVPIAFGVPFGAGNSISFIYVSQYLAGAYGIYAASALASNALMRSIFGAMLPLAGPRMYAALTPQWAGTLLGLLEVLMVPVPFIFWRYGARIRAKSRVISQMREDQARMEEKRVRAREKAERRRRWEQRGVGRQDNEEDEDEADAADVPGDKVAGVGVHQAEQDDDSRRDEAV